MAHRHLHHQYSVIGLIMWHLALATVTSCYNFPISYTVLNFYFYFVMKLVATIVINVGHLIAHCTSNCLKIIFSPTFKNK
jgi:hypothetical protein